MSNVLLPYFFPITSIEPTAQASTAFLKQVLVVVQKKIGGTDGLITLCTSNSAVAALTDNLDCAQLFAAGMSRVYVMTVNNNLDIADYLDDHLTEFFTILISSDFDKDDITQAAAYGTVTITSYANLVSGTDDVITVNGTAFTAQAGAATLGTATFQAATSNDATAASLAAQINAHADLEDVVLATVVGSVVTITALETGYAGNDITLTYTDNDTNVGATLAHLSAGKLSGGAGLFLGDFDGVTGVAEDDLTFLATQAAMTRRCAFFSKSSNGAKNMFYAFGKLLSNASDWKNQQYIAVVADDDVDTKGEADALFDDDISFAINDDEYSNRLGLFAAGGKAIVAPYIAKNLQVNMQSEALTYVSGNQPAFTKKQAALLEDELKKNVIDVFIAREWIEDGTVSITLSEDQDFVAEGDINIAEPSALWRIFGSMQQTL